MTLSYFLTIIAASSDSGGQAMSGLFLPTRKSPEATVTISTYSMELNLNM